MFTTRGSVAKHLEINRLLTLHILLLIYLVCLSIQNYSSANPTEATKPKMCVGKDDTVRGTGILESSLNYENNR